VGQAAAKRFFAHFMIKSAVVLNKIITFAPC
jgi:hypothetical protein